MITMLSYGAGQDSWALLLRYVYDRVFRATYAPGRYIVAMADTLTEHPHTYEHVAYTREFCAKHGIEFHVVHPNLGFHGKGWENGVIGQLEEKSTITSVAFPSAACTANAKIAPIYAWFDDLLGREYGYPHGHGKPALKQWAIEHGTKIQMQIGFSVGEEGRAGISKSLQEAFAFACAERNSDPKWMQDAINKVYPLIDLGLDRTGAQDYARSVGEIVPWPSACWSCHWKSDADVLWTQLAYPDLFARWAAAEAQKLAAWGDPEFRRARQRNFQPNETFKNSPVGGRFWKDGRPIVLTDRAADARRELAKAGLVSDVDLVAYLGERRMRDGHGVKSKAA